MQFVLQFRYTHINGYLLLRYIHPLKCEVLSQNTPILLKSDKFHILGDTIPFPNIWNAQRAARCTLQHASVHFMSHPLKCGGDIETQTFSVKDGQV